MLEHVILFFSDSHYQHEIHEDLAFLTRDFNSACPLEIIYFFNLLAQDGKKMVALASKV